VDLIASGRLEFEAPDEGAIPRPSDRPVRPVSPVLEQVAALISADEVAVARFLDGSLDFNGIARLLGASVERFRAGRVSRRRPWKGSSRWMRGSSFRGRPNR